MPILFCRRINVNDMINKKLLIILVSIILTVATAVTVTLVIVLNKPPEEDPNPPAPIVKPEPGLDLPIIGIE